MEEVFNFVCRVLSVLGPCLHLSILHAGVGCVFMKLALVASWPDGAAATHGKQAYIELGLLNLTTQSMTSRLELAARVFSMESTLVNLPSLVPTGS